MESGAWDVGLRKGSRHGGLGMGEEWDRAARWWVIREDVSFLMWIFVFEDRSS